jgi:hypothetical protein
LFCPTSEPDPAGVALLGTGASVGQFGGSFPSNETDTCPSEVEISNELLADVVVVEDVVVLDEHAASTRAATTRMPTRMLLPTLRPGERRRPYGSKCTDFSVR